MGVADNSIPLLYGPDGKTLSSSTGGDVYYLIDEEGRAEKISLAQASSLWAASPGNGWTRGGQGKVRSRPRRSKSKPKAAADEKRREDWRAELRQKLGLEE